MRKIDCDFFLQVNQFLLDSDQRLQHLIVSLFGILNDSKFCIRTPNCNQKQKLFRDSRESVRSILCDIRGAATYTGAPAIIDYEQVLRSAKNDFNEYREIVTLMQAINQLEYMLEILELSIQSHP